MKLLLDTHVWLWWNTAPEKLSAAVRKQIADPNNDVFLSAASVWEMAIKRGLGRLRLPEPVVSYVARRLAVDNIESLPISIEHAAAVETLDRLHDDPFDRLLVVQARQAGLRLLTADQKVLAYGAPATDARA